MKRIIQIVGREILDSRGNPTVEAGSQFPPALLPESTMPASCGQQISG